MKKDWIYNRNVKELVCKEWQPILQAFIDSVDDYLFDEDIEFNVSYIKDKY